MERLRCVWERIVAMFSLGVVIVGIIATFVLVGRVLQPIGPAITLMFVAILTLCTFADKVTGFLAVNGILIYCMSWPVMRHVGPWPATIFCFVGLFGWGVAVHRVFTSPHDLHNRPVRCFICTIRERAELLRACL